MRWRFEGNNPPLLQDSRHARERRRDCSGGDHITVYDGNNGNRREQRCAAIGQKAHSSRRERKDAGDKEYRRLGPHRIGCKKG